MTTLADFSGQIARIRERHTQESMAGATPGRWCAHEDRGQLLAIISFIVSEEEKKRKGHKT